MSGGSRRRVLHLGAITEKEGEQDDYEVPFTLGVDTEGEAQSEPVYDGDSTSDDDSSSSSDDTSSGSDDSSTSGDTENAVAESDESSVSWLPIVLGVAGFVLLAGGTLAVRAARKT